MRQFELHFSCFPKKGFTFRNVKSPNPCRSLISNVYKDANNVQTWIKFQAAGTAGDVYVLWNPGMELPHVNVLTSKFL